MNAPEPTRGGYLAVCLNPVIQKTLVYPRLVPGEVNRTAEHRVDVAGKGICVTRVLGQLGRRVVHLTQLGGPTRDWFLDMCEADGLELSWVESGSEIRFCTTLIDQGSGEATELVEEARPVQPGTAERVLAQFSALLPACATVMLSGTVAAGFPADIMPRMAALAAAAGKRLFLDLKGRALLDSLSARPTLVKPNLEELYQTYEPGRSRPGVDADEASIRELVSRAGREYRERYGSWLVVTRGTEPTLFWDGQGLRSAPVQAAKALNPIGSGDSFNVGVATALEDGATIAEAVAEGNRLGALNAERLKPGSIA
ncbi:MAG TPA: PfkB family carbohydrate kinase [Rectinemataceae bacterium]|nr:PfkB family carbohydrate kinase [Rectinemataceae bacterium]